MKRSGVSSVFQVASRFFQVRVLPGSNVYKGTWKLLPSPIGDCRPSEEGFFLLVADHGKGHRERRRAAARLSRQKSRPPAAATSFGLGKNAGFSCSSDWPPTKVIDLSSLSAAGPSYARLAPRLPLAAATNPAAQYPSIESPAQTVATRSLVEHPKIAGRARATG